MKVVAMHLTFGQCMGPIQLLSNAYVKLWTGQLHLLGWTTMASMVCSMLHVHVVSPASWGKIEDVRCEPNSIHSLRSIILIPFCHPCCHVYEILSWDSSNVTQNELVHSFLISATRHCQTWPMIQASVTPNLLSKVQPIASALHALPHKIIITRHRSTHWMGSK